MSLRTFQPLPTHPSPGADLCPSMLSHRHIENSLLLYVLSKLTVCHSMWLYSPDPSAQPWIQRN